jgi:ethanolamine utilization microcompartment shell protein EutS
MASNLYYSSDFQKLSFGDNGLRYLVTGDTSVSGESFGAIQVIDSAIISCDIDTAGGDSSLTSISLFAGTIIYGNFDDIVVTSGKVIAYLR